MRSGGIDNIRFLRLLLKDFNIHKNAFLFVITKAAENTSLPAIKKFLKFSFEQIINNEEYAKEDREFCKQILNSPSGILEHKVRIYNPCSPTSALDKVNMLNEIKNFSYLTPFPKENYGLPLSNTVASSIKETRNTIIFHAQDTLSNLIPALSQYWQNRTQNANVDETKTCLAELDAWLLNAKEELPHFASPTYEKVSAALTAELKLCSTYWDKMNLLSQHQPMENLTNHFKNIIDKLRKIREDVKKLYYDRMYKEIKASFVEKLQSYEVQRQIAALKTSLAINANALDIQNVQTFTTTLKNLTDRVALTFKHQNYIALILADDSTKCAEFKKIIKDNILNSLDVTATASKITIHPIVDKFALSAALKDLPDFKELFIMAQSPTQAKVLYFDQDLNGERFKGKTIYIQSDLLEVIPNSSNEYKIQLDSSNPWSPKGSFTFKGRLKGTSEIADKCFRFHPTNTNNNNNANDNMIKFLPCSFPL